VSVNVNLLELNLKMETQPPNMELMTWFATFVEKIEVLRELGRTYENAGRPCEAADIFINTVVDARYKDFKRDYLTAHYSDDRRSLATLANWITTRAWACEQDFGDAQHRGLVTTADDDDVETEAQETALAGRAVLRKLANNNSKTLHSTNTPVTTTIDVSAYNKATLKSMGLKLVPINQPRKPAAAGRNPSPPPNPTGRHYCWTHGIGNHPSNKCTNKADGHQNNATANNKMGGSQNAMKGYK
jgi:hypothetical protein